MQLNPARGRKLHKVINESKFVTEVYAAQPREGTETLFFLSTITFATGLVYAAQPREGTETVTVG